MITLGEIRVRRTEPRDFPQIIAVTRLVYPYARPWSEQQLASHVHVFPEGQLVAVQGDPDRVVGMAASLIVLWDDYDPAASWRDFTEGGMFTNHDPDHGRTLYGAEVMVHPALQGRGIGKRLYGARRDLVERLKLARIRAGARLRGYRLHADRMSAKEYVERVVRGELTDATLTFQLKQGFRVFGVVPHYLGHDPESLGHAALIEWLNPTVATAPDVAGRDTTHDRA